MLVPRWHKAVEVDVVLVEKYGTGVKPSAFVMFNFYDLVINIH
jgi:hypothetical protein